MKMSSKTIAFIYFGLALLFIFLAIQNVNVNGWDIWTFLFAGIAAIDLMVGVRFYRMQPK
ncbi:YdiK family protein [Aliibacillus thermotolerans]|uniref:YdiK family protein n=1 Tax=Aliibacillus thermotolerans TaxID=1834418 RepID=A0ABW0U8H4_9BACI|nr:YdiK family protein [Aliibacillus thermotolerans]MDA3130450.1 DUF4305 domain-containing protein [Aliibacillus thermotolerans]